jgi:acetylornithine deacetylase/succinyl-diaminopimelate desuccinylase-like protein
MQVASRAPAAMLFVPSVAGVSHAPHEATATTDLAVGAEVLAGAILRLDAAT